MSPMPPAGADPWAVAVARLAPIAVAVLIAYVVAVVLIPQLFWWVWVAGALVIYVPGAVILKRAGVFDRSRR